MSAIALTSGAPDALLDRNLVRRTLLRLGLDEDAVAEVLQHGQDEGAFAPSPQQHQEGAAESGQVATPLLLSSPPANQGNASGSNSDVHVSPPRRGEMPKMSYDESFDLDGNEEMNPPPMHAGGGFHATAATSNSLQKKEEVDSATWAAAPGSAALLDTSDLKDLVEELRRATEREGKFMMPPPSASSPPRMRDARPRIAAACRGSSPLRPEEFACQNQADKKKKRSTRKRSTPRPRAAYMDPTFTIGSAAQEERMKAAEQDREIDARLDALYKSEQHASQRCRSSDHVARWLLKHSVLRCGPPPISTYFPGRIDRPDIVARSAQVGTIMSASVKRGHGDYLGAVVARSTAARSQSRGKASSPLIIAGGLRYQQPTYAPAIHRPIGIPTSLPSSLRCDVVTRANEYEAHWRRCRILNNLEKRTADTWAARFAILDTR